MDIDEIELGIIFIVLGIVGFLILYPKKNKLHSDRTNWVQKQFLIKSIFALFITLIGLFVLIRYFI